MASHEVFIHIHQGCIAGTGAIVRLPQCQWSKPDGYGKISQFITTTKHSKAWTVCIFLGIYCRTAKLRVAVQQAWVALTPVGLRTLVQSTRTILTACGGYTHYYPSLYNVIDPFYRLAKFDNEISVRPFCYRHYSLIHFTVAPRDTTAHCLHLTGNNTGVATPELVTFGVETNSTQPRPWSHSGIAINSSFNDYPDSKVHGANMGPTWGRQDPGGPHVGHVNLVIWVVM